MLAKFLFLVISCVIYLSELHGRKKQKGYKEEYR